MLVGALLLEAGKSFFEQLGRRLQASAFHGRLLQESSTVRGIIAGHYRTGALMFLAILPK